MITFQDFGLNPMILQAIAEIGFETPTAIQCKTIPHLKNSNNDLIALAQTGTGKTAAFAIPIIEKLSDKVDTVQSLILCPTRELGIQIANDIKTFIKYSPKVKVSVVYGGDSIERQIRELKNKPQIVVGTPGRVNDLIRRRVLKVENIKWLVLDEADEMLNMGFKEELDEILVTMPSEKQVLLFSATMNQAVRKIANNYMKKPEEITVGEKNKGAENVQHQYYIVHEKDRYQVLRRIADVNPDIHGIVFCKTRRETQMIADKLIQDHYSAEAIHGDISQSQRTAVMNRFKDKKTQLLVATDVAARGIDVKELTHVINYNLPESPEVYLHRSGRTGRANSFGVSLVILNMREKYMVGLLERKVGKPFEKGFIPTGKDICEKQLFKLIDKICNTEVNEEQIGKYTELLAKKFEHLSKEELIKKFVSEEFNRFLEFYKGATDLNANVSQETSPQGRKSSILFARFKISAGRNLGLNIKEFFQFLNSQPSLKNVEIGNIDIQKETTTFEIDGSYKEKVMECFQNVDIDDIPLNIKCEETGIISTRLQNNKGGGRKPRELEKGRSHGYSQSRHKRMPRKKNRF